MEVMVIMDDNAEVNGAAAVSEKNTKSKSIIYEEFLKNPPFKCLTNFHGADENYDLCREIEIEYHINKNCYFLAHNPLFDISDDMLMIQSENEFDFTKNGCWEAMATVYIYSLVFKITDEQFDDEQWLADNGLDIIYEPKDSIPDKNSAFHRVYTHVKDIKINCNTKSPMKGAINIYGNIPSDRDLLVSKKEHIKFIDEEPHFLPALHYWAPDLDFNKKGISYLSKYKKIKIN